MTIRLDARAVAGRRGLIAQRGELGAAALPGGEPRLEGLVGGGGGAYEDALLAGIEQQHLALGHRLADGAAAAEHRHPHRTRDDGDVRGERAFLQHHALQPAAIIFEQFRRPQVARDQDRVLPEPQLRGGAELARHGAQQPVGEILQIVHPVAQQRIVDLAHPHPGALLDTLDRGLGGQPAVDRLVDAPAPTLVIGEHLVRREHVLVLAGHAELGLAGHPVDLLAHLPERRIDPLALGLDILRHGLRDDDARLVEHRATARHAVDELEPRQRHRPGIARAAAAGAALVDQAGRGDQLGEHHRHRLQRLDLDIVVAPARLVLDAQHADRRLAPHDRHAREAVEQLLAGLRIVDETGVAGGLREIERLDMLRDRADQTFAQRQLGDVDRLLQQAAGRIELEHAVAQQVDRADLAIERFADHLHDGVELGLRVQAARHHVVQPGQYLAGGGGGGGGGRRGHRQRLSDHGAIVSLSRRRGRWTHRQFGLTPQSVKPSFGGMDRSSATRIATPPPMARDVLELLKPVTWFPPIWAFMCGVVSSGVPLADRWPFLIAGAALTGPLVCGTSQAVNDWFDRHVDAINQPERPIPSGRIAGRWGLWIACLGTLLSLAVAAATGRWVLGATCLGLACAWGYSAPPFRFKVSGIWGPAVVALTYEGLTWFTGAAVMAGALPETRVLAILALYSIGAHGIMTLNDFKAVEGDRATGLRSLPVVMGVDGAVRLACVVMAVPQAIVVALLAVWGHALAAGLVAALLAGQAGLMPRLLRDPRGQAPWYNATGTSLYVFGMLAAAFGLGGAVGL